MFGEHAALDYAPEGVGYELVVSLSQIQATDNVENLSHFQD
jgi:hypothetical protein